MKKAITGFTLALVLMVGTTFAGDGIIVAGKGEPACGTAKDDGIIVAGITGIIVAGFTGIIVAGRDGLLVSDKGTGCSTSKDGIIVAGRDGIIVSD